MQEKDANGKARDFIRKECVHAKVYKHNDRATKGMPDTSVTWADATSWLEFKMLHGEESIHNELDPIQLVELVRLEQQCHRAWVVAYRKGNKHVGDSLTIYRPTALLRGEVPVAKELTLHVNILRDLRVFGVARFEGLDHAAVVALIKATHGTY
jgi:hypothetical protein